jgi:hypothetical protein
MSGHPDKDATRSRQSASADVDRPSDRGAHEFHLSEEAVRAIEEQSYTAATWRNRSCQLKQNKGENMEARVGFEPINPIDSA